MTFKKSLLCLGLSAMLFSSVSMAADPSDVSTGTVDFNGSIVNTPCAITAANQNLSVFIGPVKSSVFTAKGTTGPMNPKDDFVVVLSNCTVSATDVGHVTVTFNGNGADTGKTSLAVNAGSDTSGAAVATGVGIQILDSAGVIQNLGVPSGEVAIDKTEIRIPFNARYISVADTVTPGLANGHADFTVAYN